MVNSKLIFKKLGGEVLKYLESESDFDALERYVLDIERQGTLVSKLYQQIVHALYHLDQDTFTHKDNTRYLSEMKELLRQMSIMMIQSNIDGIPKILDKFYNLPIAKDEPT